MKRFGYTVSIFFFMLFFIGATGCKNPIELVPTNEEPTVKADHIVDLSAGTNIWGSGGTTTVNQDSSVTIQFTASQYQAWGINLYTGSVAGIDFTDYDSIVLVASTVNATDEFSFALLCGGLTTDDEALKQFKTNSATGKKTYAISLSGVTAEDLANVQQIVFQNSLAGMSLTIHSITFKVAQTSSGGDYALDLSSGVNIWGSVTGMVANTNASVTLTFENGQYKAWAIDPLKTDYTGYTSLEIVATTGSIDGKTPDEFKIMTLGVDQSYDTNGLEAWFGSSGTGKHTYTIDLSLADNWGVAEFATELANIGRVIIQNKQANMVLILHSIVFK